MACFMTNSGVGDAKPLNALRVPLEVGKEVAIVCKKCHKQAVPVAMFLQIRAMLKEAFVTEVVGLGCGAVASAEPSPNACAFE